MSVRRRPGAWQTMTAFVSATFALIKKLLSEWIFLSSRLKVLEFGMRLGRSWMFIHTKRLAGY